MKTILLIEDDADMRENTAEILDLAGYSVITAENGRRGVEEAKKQSPDLILCDIMMPELDGYGVLHMLGRSPATAEIPFVFLSAKAERGDVRKGMELGADDYLTKPFSWVVLVARVRALVRRAAPTSPRELVVGDLRLLPSAHRCYRGDHEIVLTAREFAVLEQLARRAGQAVSKSDILDAVWDMAYAGDLNVVEVHVSALRRKVDAPFDRASIETVRGVGYRLVADG